MRHVVILAGGSGTRLWPLSRQGEPKQFLPMFEGTSLLRIAFERIRDLVPLDNIWICTGASHLSTVAAQLPEIKAANLLGEPCGRDSLNAIAWSAAEISRRDPDAVMAALSADQIIRPVEVLNQRLDEAFTVAETTDQAMVLLGVVPTSPATGFGYLEQGEPLSGHTVEITRFVEKPDAETAQSYLDSGRYWWNSGMFVWKTRTFLDALAVVLPQTHQNLLSAAGDAQALAAVYPGLVKISVDYAVMEPVSAGQAPGRVLGVELPIEWYDVGSFASLAEHLPADGDGNRVDGAVVQVDASGNLLINTRSAASVLAVAGVTELAVVTTDTATLVVPLHQSQMVKEVVARVSEHHGEALA